MILEKLHIAGFGKFSDYSLDFSPSLQILYGENEAGKSTIHAFIQAMLYGIPKGASKREAFFQYRPFSGATAFGGSLELSYQGKSYRVQRDFLQEGEAEVTALASGQLVPDGESFLQTVLAPFSLDSFKNTVSIRQLKSSTEREMVFELQKMLSNFQQSGNVELSPDAALRYLDKEEAALLEKMVPEATKRYSSLLGEVKNTQKALSQIHEGELLDADAIPENEALSDASVEEIPLSKESPSLEKQKERIQEIKNDLEALSTLLEKEEVRDKEALLEEQDRMLLYLNHAQEEKELGKGSLILYPIFCLFALCFAILTVMSFLYAYTMISLPPFPFFSMGFSAYLYPFFCAFLLFLLLALSQKRVFEQHQNWIKKEKQEFEELLGKRQISAFLQFQNSSKEELSEKGASQGYSQAKIMQYYSTILEKWTEREEKAKLLQTLEENYEKEQALWKESSLAESQREQREELLRQYGILQNKADLLRPSLEENEKLQEKLESIREAKERIQQIATEIRNSFAFHLNDNCGHALAEITNGRYDSLWIDENLQLYVNAKEGFFPLEQASTGTIDQLYLALRLSIALLLQRENQEYLPLLFDDSFAMYDERRLSASLSYLKKAYPAQILLFTCHHREAKILQELGIPFEQTELK